MPDERDQLADQCEHQDQRIQQLEEQLTEMTAEREAFKVEVERLRDAVYEAEQSLLSISYAGLRTCNECLQDMIDVRGYSASRARVAAKALRGEGASDVNK